MMPRLTTPQRRCRMTTTASKSFLTSPKRWLLPSGRRPLLAHVAQRPLHIRQRRICLLKFSFMSLDRSIRPRTCTMLSSCQRRGASVPSSSSGTARRSQTSHVLSRCSLSSAANKKRSITPASSVASTSSPSTASCLTPSSFDSLDV